MATKQNDAKQKAENLALKKALTPITKKYGKGSVMEMDKMPHMHLKRWSTGSIALDRAIGGGIPAGRIIELYGAPSAGKTTVALTICASIQHHGGKVAYIDAEDSLDKDYANALGVDTSHFLLSQPDSGEEGLDVADALASSGAIDLIVVDSVSALLPQQEIDGSIGDSHVGLQARLMSQGLRKLAKTLSKTDTAIIFINQMRKKVGVMFGNPNTTSGGVALKYYASIRMAISRGKKLKNGQDIYGNHAKVRVTKNKTFPPYKHCFLNILYDQKHHDFGISQVDELLAYGAKLHLIDKGGAWYTIYGKRIQGQANAHQYVADNPNIREKLNAQVRNTLHLPLSDKDKEVLKADGTTVNANSDKLTSKKKSSTTKTSKTTSKTKSK